VCLPLHLLQVRRRERNLLLHLRKLADPGQALPVPLLSEAVPLLSRPEALLLRWVDPLLLLVALLLLWADLLLLAVSVLLNLKPHPLPPLLNQQQQPAARQAAVLVAEIFLAS